MQNFIVLGYIPGTHIQITFYAWLVSCALFGLLAFIWFKSDVVRTWLVSRRLHAYFKHLPIDHLAI